MSHHSILHKYFFLTISIFMMLFAINVHSKSGHIEAGAIIEHGNTESKSYYGSIKKEHIISNKAKNIFNSRAENKEENYVRSKEEYRLNNQTRYLFTDFNYTFLELEYVSDRYGGYNYRSSETIGLGRKLIKKDNIDLILQSSAGLRQSETSDDIKQDGWVIRFASNLDLKLKNDLFFEQNIDLSIDDNNIITKSNTNLKLIILKSFYFKLDFSLEHKKNVPSDIKNTDSRMILVIGYEM